LEGVVDRAEADFVEAIVGLTRVGEGRAMENAEMHGPGGSSKEGRGWSAGNAEIRPQNYLLLLLLLLLRAGFRGIKHRGLDDFLADGIERFLDFLQELVEALVNDVGDSERLEIAQQAAGGAGGIGFGAGARLTEDAAEEIGRFARRSSGASVGRNRKDRRNSAAFQGKDRADVGAAVGLERAGGAEHGLPLGGVDGAADIGSVGKQDVVFNIEDAGSLIGTFDVFPKLNELPALAARIGGAGEALEKVGGLLDAGEEAHAVPTAQTSVVFWDFK